MVLAAALSDRFANDESLEAVASCSTIATACPGGIGDEKSPTSEGLDDSVTLVPPATEPTQCQGGDKASKTEQIAEKRKKKARNSSPANPGLFTSEEVNANGSSPPIAADNAAPQQEPRDVGKSAESTINVDDESSEDSDSDESSAFADYKMVFNLADYLPERGYTKVPPNQYVFKGAELPFEYEMAEDLLRSQGAISLLEESTSLASSPSTSSTTSCDQPSTGDVFMRHLLRRCAMDQELQRHREARRNGEVGDLEVIDCDLSSSPSSCGEAKTAEKPATTKASSAHQTEEEADALQPTTSTPPLTKRRRCSSEVAGDEDGDAAATAAASSTGKTVDV
ncbi:unnamed protein product [Mesocestoides corti]|uniref:Uncharacterized protein n=1 Tax=Mesocestoides corti TaxID=53468 RepID=A0A3P6GHM6_MESCO|nr:unnamed protein product [Mesocestoides corti]